MMQLVIWSAILMFVCHAYPYFQNKIPNGQHIPHACGTEDIWSGVGHVNLDGGGAINPFGKDFGDNGYVWDKCLCRHDSDGDGRTNGEELGDPYCVWQPGMSPSSTDNLSHPGVCEPVGSLQCKEVNWWLDCDALAPFSCPAFHYPDTESFTMHIEPTRVPAVETTYMCGAMQLPQTVREGDFHMIGAEVIIDNVDVMHHMLIYSCPDDVADTVMDLYDTPRDCGKMVTDYCDQLLFLWAFGITPDCFAEEYGQKLGSNGTKTVVFEMHWNNPLLVPNTMDSSGVKIYYTSNLREYDSANAFYGVRYLEIPPNQQGFVQEGVCPGECTRQMYAEPIYITLIVPHMHLIGRAMRVVHIRNGNVLQVLVNERQFDYNSPKRFVFNPAIEFLPGDDLHTQCVFDSESRDAYTYYGDGVNDEMCIAVVRFYPSQSTGGNCVAYQNNTVGKCGPLGLYGEHNLYDCYGIYEREETFQSFVQYEYIPYIQQLNQSCDPKGLQCFEGCKEVIGYITLQRCFTDDVIGWTKLYLLPVIDSRKILPFEATMMVRQALASCDDHKNNATPKKIENAHENDDAYNDEASVDGCRFGGSSQPNWDKPSPPVASSDMLRVVTSLIAMTSLVLLICQ